MTDDKVSVWVLDSCALIKMKERQTIAVDEQWRVFRAMEDLVRAGEIAIPRQVINEMKDVAHPDLPGTWAVGMRSVLRHSPDAHPDDLRRVMSEAGGVVDLSKQTEDADPYVLALALTLQNAGHAVCVVTEDVVDRKRLSVGTACDRLGLPHARASEFLARRGLGAGKGR